MRPGGGVIEHRQQRGDRARGLGRDQLRRLRGRQQLGDLMRAIGLSKVTDTDQLISGSLQIKLAIREQEGYEPSNDVKGYKSVSGGVPTFAAPASPSAPQSAKSAPPWTKK